MRQTDASNNVQTTGLASFGDLKIDTSAPSVNFSQGYKLYWKYTGTTNWLETSGPLVINGGQRIDLSLFVTNVAAIDVFATASPWSAGWSAINGNTLLKSFRDPVIQGAYDTWVYDNKWDLGSITIPDNACNATSAALHYGYSMDFVMTTLAGVTRTANMIYLVPGGNTTPLILDLNGDGVRTSSMVNGVYFDIAATGQSVLTGWTDGKDGLLALDLDGDGKINDGSELFGAGTNLATGKATNGYEALGQYDLNKDKVIDATDAVFTNLVVWADANGDGITQAGELHSLADLGVASISLAALSGTQEDNGNIFGMTSSWTGVDGQVHDMADVWFKNQSLESLLKQPAQSIDLHSDPAPNVKDLRLADVQAVKDGVIVVTAGLNDEVRLEHTGWVNTGVVASAESHAYALWSNGGAHLLIDQNATVHQVL